MKVTYHIPTEQYGFVEVEDEIKLFTDMYSYEGVKALVAPQNAPGEGLAPKDWNKALDEYLRSNTMDAEVYYAMNEKQQCVIQEIKRAVKRINYNETKDNIH